jgi:hypothetical protein
MSQRAGRGPTLAGALKGGGVQDGNKDYEQDVTGKWLWVVAASDGI